MPIHSTETLIIWKIGDKFKMIAKNDNVNLSYDRNIIKVTEVRYLGSYRVEVIEGAMKGRFTEITPSESKWVFELLSEWDL